MILALPGQAKPNTKISGRKKYQSEIPKPFYYPFTGPTAPFKITKVKIHKRITFKLSLHFPPLLDTSRP